MLDRSIPVSWGGQVVAATGAGLCFLIAALGPGVLLGYIDELVSKPGPFDWLRVGQALIVVICLVGAAACVRLGLWLAGDFLPPPAIVWRPLRYAVTAAMIPILATLAIPMLPVTFAAAVIVRYAGPVLDRRLTKNCLGCGSVRSATRPNDDPVFCEEHERFFGGDVYRLVMSNEGGE